MSQHTKNQIDDADLEALPQEKLGYFPIQMRVDGLPIIICGATDDSLAKVRLLLKTAAKIIIYDEEFSAEFLRLAAQHKVFLKKGKPSQSALKEAVMGYIGYEDDAARKVLQTAFQKAGTPVCLIDDKQGSDFITPAIIDRSPITIAIGSEGLAPVMVRRIKALIEKTIPLSVGRLTRLAGGLRKAAERLPKGGLRRQFWAEIFDNRGPDILRRYAIDKQEQAFNREADKLIHTLTSKKTVKRAVVTFVSAGPGDAGLLTRAGEKALDDADIILHDRLVSPSVLELCRREAIFMDVGKKGFASGFSQTAINDILVKAAATGQKIVRLKGGDAGVFGRLDEEISALHEQGFDFHVIPGVTSACAMAAEMGVSLSQRGRNRKVSFCTGYQLGGYAEHDWRQLTEKGAVTAIYMGRKAAGFLQGRLLMFGADNDMPVTIASAVASPSAQWTITTLARLSEDVCRHHEDVPLLILLGLTPHKNFAKANWNLFQTGMAEPFLAEKKAFAE